MSKTKGKIFVTVQNKLKGEHGSIDIIIKISNGIILKVRDESYRSKNKYDEIKTFTQR